MSKRQKHIVFMTWKDSAHPRAGGAEKVMEIYAGGLVKKGYQVTRFASSFPGAKKEEMRNGVHIMRKYSLYTIYFFAWIWWRKFKKSKEVDIIIDEAGGVPLLTPLYEKKVPKIFFIHHIGDAERERDLPFPLSKLGKWFYQRTIRLYKNHKTITVSHSTKQELIQKYGFENENITVLENSVDLKIPTHLSIQEKKNEIVFLGRLAPIKRVEHAIQAFSVLYAKDNSYVLHIVGDPQDDTYYTSLKKLARELGIFDVVFFHGFSIVNREKYLTRGKASLVPSEKEGFGLVVLEGNVFGCPVLGYDVAGLKDSIHDGINGYLIEDGNRNAMGEKLSEMVQDEKAYKTLAKSSLDHVKNLEGRDEKVEKLESLLCKI